jgi:hypothetical protein
MNSRGTNLARGNYFAGRVGEYLAHNDPLLVECKAYNWTAGGNSPSAKFSTANEALLCFQAAPESYCKAMFIAATERKPGRRPETLADYWVRQYGHLIPNDVEIVELNPTDLSAKHLLPLQV